MRIRDRLCIQALVEKYGADSRRLQSTIGTNKGCNPVTPPAEASVYINLPKPYHVVTECGNRKAMDLREQMERIYRDIPLESIPWNLSEPPELLVTALEAGRIKPCQVVDLGCGAGNYAVWLAQQGFDVTGLDISREAIKHANSLAAREGVSCRFEVADLLGDLRDLHGSFDLALDWEVLHHVFPEDRPRYIENVHSMLRPAGIYLSLCFSENDHAFGGVGKYRDTPLGTTLYFSSEEELRDLFAPFFDILDLNTVETPGKHSPHMANMAWLKRK